MARRSDSITFQSLHYGWKAILTRQRFLGKRMVNEVLNDLVVEKYMVVEDMNLYGLPLDHVVIGPAGVFLLEIQTAMQRRSILNPRTPTKPPTMDEVWFFGDDG